MIKCQTFFVSELGLIGNLGEELGVKKIYECQAIARVLHIGIYPTALLFTLGNNSCTRLR